jgi:hypothetical protein
MKNGLGARLAGSKQVGAKVVFCTKNDFAICQSTMRFLAELMLKFCGLMFHFFDS